MPVRALELSFMAYNKNRVKASPFPFNLLYEGKNIPVPCHGNIWR
jgi:hypothetical protein